MHSEISKGRRVKPPSEIYWPEDLLPYTLQGISRKYALLLGQCGGNMHNLLRVIMFQIRIHSRLLAASGEG
jgi:hypothetical protein